MTPALVLKKSERHGVGHGFVACGGWMQVVTAIVGGEQAILVGWIFYYCVEVDYGVEVAFGANPLID